MQWQFWHEVKKKTVTWSYMWMRGHWNTWIPKELALRPSSIHWSNNAGFTGQKYTFYGLRNCNESMKRRLIHYIYKQDSIVIVWILGLHKSLKCLNKQGAFQKPVIFTNCCCAPPVVHFNNTWGISLQAKAFTSWEWKNRGTKLEWDENLGEQCWVKLL